MTRPDNRRAMHPFLRTCALLVAAAASAAAAETVYVVDQLLVGIHQDRNLDSAILKVLPTGTELEVIERDGELALVADPEGVRGWVDGAYLTAERPAQLRLAELEREKAALEEKVAELEKRPAGAPVPDDAGEAQARVESLTRENTELKGKLSDVRLQAGKLQTELSELRAEVQAAETPPDLRVAELEQARDALGRELDEAAERIARLEAQASREDARALVPIVLETYATWIIVGLVVLVLIGFGAGIYLMDTLSRRRHGGFRV